MGLEGAQSVTWIVWLLTQNVEPGFYVTGSLNDSSSERIRFPGLLAGHKDSGVTTTQGTGERPVQGEGI